jgi:Zn-dependent M28 family amino/carboxypeptidase
MVPPGPLAAQDEGARATVSRDSARIMAEITFLASDSLRGRAPGTPGSAAARQLLLDDFREAGVRPFGASHTRAFSFSGRGGEERTGVNVVGWLPGTGAGERWIALTAHYDHVGVRDGRIYNGADDNASGTTALLFLARWLAEHPLRHPVLLAALDAEESGLRGARALVADPPVPLDSVAVDLNMDMLSRGNGTLWAAGAHHTPTLGPILDAVAAQAPMTLRQGHDDPDVQGRDDWTHSSDHGAFHDRGIPFVYLGVEDHPDVHRPTDDVERIDPPDYLDAIATALLTLRALDDALPLPGGDAP